MDNLRTHPNPEAIAFIEAAGATVGHHQLVWPALCTAAMHEAIGVVLTHVEGAGRGRGRHTAALTRRGLPREGER